MFKRKIEEQLLQWKQNLSFNRKAFVIKGLRQVGKTFIAKKFAYENYENVLYINFKINQDMKLCFTDSLEVDDIIMNLTSKKIDCKIIPNKTVIILDEIQECASARASIKSFVEDGRYDIIATGSLLGIKGYNNCYKGGVSVGYEHTVYLKPLDFEEFLWAIGVKEEVVEYIKNCFMTKNAINNAIHTSMLRYFKEYICVGGMPSVVKVFKKSNDFNLVLQEQRDIIEGYKDDFAKHLDEYENEKINKDLLLKINRVFDSIPSQLSKENKKFMISKIDKKSSIEKYEEAIQWLIDYGLISLSYNLSVLENPLEGNKINNIFKIYMADSGLLIACLEDGTSSEILLNDMGIYKGAIYENIIADAFSKNNKKLYYFSKSSGLEIDFITKYKNEITLIEVKAKNGNTKSSKEVLSNNDRYPEANKLIVLKECNIGEKDNTLSIPYYLAFLL